MQIITKLFMQLSDVSIDILALNKCSVLTYLFFSTCITSRRVALVISTLNGI